jgi:hypothetical protein
MVGQERRRGPTPLSPHWLIERAPRTGPLDVTDTNRAYDVFVRDLATGGDEVVGVRGEGRRSARFSNSVAAAGPWRVAAAVGCLGA